MSTLKISSDLADMQFEMIHDFLRRSYWSEGISVSRMKRAMENSINIGAFQDGKQVAYARVISDHATFAYLCDVFVVESARDQGISKKILRYILQLPELKGIKRFNLCTKDAHGLYMQFGWTELEDPGRYMEINRPGIFKLLDEE